MEIYNGFLDLFLDFYIDLGCKGRPYVRCDDCVLCDDMAFLTTLYLYNIIIANKSCIFKNCLICWKTKQIEKSLNSVHLRAQGPPRLTRGWRRKGT